MRPALRSVLLVVVTASLTLAALGHRPHGHAQRLQADAQALGRLGPGGDGRLRAAGQERGQPAHRARELVQISGRAQAETDGLR